MLKQALEPHHINATIEELEGNEGIGRYILLPGSDGRAKEIAKYFENLTVKNHPRGHNLYLGTIKSNGKKIDVATISTGIGCPSTEIILHELYNLGAKRFLRIGSAGTLQSGLIHPGNLINVQASVRDDGTSLNYAPVEFPALASLEYVTSILVAAEKLQLEEHVHTGIVHCKSSLYAREMSAGPKSEENRNYLNMLAQSGALATEMETATLFIQSQLYNYQLMQEGDTPQYRVLAGAILGVIGTTDYYQDSHPALTAMHEAIILGLETVKVLASQELIS